jgi:GH24 family phage-related lysozyme (muramidase)
MAAMNPANLARLDTELRFDEGVRYEPYMDSRGIPTVGVGHNLGAVPLPRDWSCPLTDAQVNTLLDADLQDVFDALDQNLPWWRDLNDVRQRVLANMAFNLGVPRLLGFHNTLAAMREGRYFDAANGMRESLWATQVGDRALRLADAMEDNGGLTMNLNDAPGVVEKLTPTIASVVGGPLAGGAISMLENLFGLTPVAGAPLADRQAVVAGAISDATPDQLLAMKKADQDYATKMAELGFKNQADLAAFAVTEEQAYVADTADARRVNAGKMHVFYLACTILAIFGLVTGLSLWGAYALLTGGLPVKDASVIGMVAGFLGTIIGYTAANAQQVVGFFFGSSKGSEQKSELMASAFSRALAQPVVVAAPVGTMTSSAAAPRRGNYV